MQIAKKDILTFLAISLFYFFESAQMSYFNVLAPSFLHLGIYQPHQIAAISAAYYYGDMVGLFPVGYALDRFPLRQLLLWAIAGSILGALLLMASPNFYVQWIARFICGFFGGTVSFLGGIRILADLFSKRFTLFIGLFLAAGMFGGLVCQYPLLVMANHFGIPGAMGAVFIFGIFVGIFSFFYLHPTSSLPLSDNKNQYKGSALQMTMEILRNTRNWFDCFMVVLLDTPVSIIGSLWGVVLLMDFYHFSGVVSAWIVMSLFFGLMIGLPIWGALADRYHHPAWMVILGASVSFAFCLLMLIQPHAHAWIIAGLFFGLGLFSSCQTIGFTWITKNMKAELIGRNSAFNSMIFMGTNGGFKQMGAYLLSISPLLKSITAAGNLLILIAGAMLLSAIYASLRCCSHSIKDSK